MEMPKSTQNIKKRTANYSIYSGINYRKYNSTNYVCLYVRNIRDIYKLTAIGSEQWMLAMYFLTMWFLQCLVSQAGVAWVHTQWLWYYLHIFCHFETVDETAW